MNVNQVILVGHATRDPEVKQIGGDSKVATFRLAVNRSYKKGDTWVDKPTFVDCEAWNQKADYIADTIQTGTEIFVRGRLELDEWSHKETGDARSKLKVYVLELQVGKNRKGKPEAGATATANTNSMEISDLPF
jgi:single-strand DNA-binding protein